MVKSKPWTISGSNALGSIPLFRWRDKCFHSSAGFFCEREIKSGHISGIAGKNLRSCPSPEGLLKFSNSQLYS